VTSPKYALTSAAWFITSNRIHLDCDKGNDYNTIKDVTKKINGGFNGLDDRVNKFNLIYNRLIS
ncbi:MAG: glycoside hydrolase family 19 protein, partial [bacterium]